MPAGSRSGWASDCSKGPGTITTVSTVFIKSLKTVVFSPGNKGSRAMRDHHPSMEMNPSGLVAIYTIILL
jgi:hypothetical protein